VCSPGGIDYHEAFEQLIGGVSLANMCDNIPAPFFIVADSAYLPSQRCVPLFRTKECNAEKDNTNYYLS
jgi:hypothetical protein